MKIFSLIILSIFFCMFSEQNSTAQHRYDLDQFSDESADFIKRPLKWNGKDLLILAAISGGTFGLMQIDEPIRDEMLIDRSYVNSIPLELGRYWGEPIISSILSAAFLIQGINTKNKSNQKLGFEIFQSGLYSGGITLLFKNIFGRARPYMGQGADQFYPFQISTEKYWSMPSGHTALAFSLSTVLSGNIDNNVLKTAVFVPALVTAFSRIYYNQHWVSDVFAGACIGYFVGKYVTSIHNRQDYYEGIKPADDNLLNLSIPF